MIYQSLELVGYKRFLLNNITNFTIKPVEPIQIIIGTNGCGKSSLFSELTPLPGVPADFDKGGKKRIVVSHRQSEYILTSTFDTVTKHSFLKDEVELNVGGTISVQRELVKQEFSITNEIHEMLLGRIPFTEMSPSVRRYWFTQLSETNYEYALTVFNKLKERHRDTSGALKIAKKRLLSETSKIMNKDEKIALEKETESIYTLLGTLTDVRRPVESSLEQLEATYTKNVLEAERQTLILIKKRLKIKLVGHTNVSEIEDAMRSHRNIYEVAKQINNSIYNEFQEVTKTLATLAEAGVEDTATLRQSIDTLNHQIALKRSTLNILSEPVDDIVSLANAFTTLRPVIEAIAVELPENSDRRFTQKNKETLHEAIMTIKNDILVNENNLKQAEAVYAHQEFHLNAESITCPKCSNTWSLGFDKAIHEGSKAKAAVLRGVIFDLKALLLVKEAKMIEFTEYADLYRNFAKYVTNWPVLKPLWSHITAKQYLLDNPRKLLNECNVFQVELVTETQCSQLNHDIDKLQYQLSLKEQLGNIDTSKLNLKLALLEESMHAETIKMSSSLKEASKLESLLKDIQDITELTYYIDTLDKGIAGTRVEMVETFRRTTLLEAIRHVQSLLSKKEDILSSVNLQTGIIEDLENQITGLVNDEIALKALVTELSPTEGLIAEGLLGFIRVFCAHMNAFTKKIWTYPLVIQPCQIQTGENVFLDYKFPLMIQEDTNIIPDVANGSTGIKEVINKAFVLTAMKYLKLNNTPLYLDEFGGTMDQEHRFNAIQAVKSLIETEHFTQLFIISHNNDFSGSFNNAQICVLNKANILLPHKYNEHVEMG